MSLGRFLFWEGIAPELAASVKVQEAFLILLGGMCVWRRDGKEPSYFLAPESH